MITDKLSTARGDPDFLTGRDPASRSV
jgi:hypothetical protein